MPPSRPGLTSRRFVFIALVCFGIAGGVCMAGQQAADEQKDPSAEKEPSAREILESLDSTTLARWRRHYGFFASKIIPFEKGYVVCPTYDPQYESSRLLDMREALREYAERRRVLVGPNLTKIRTTVPPREDLEPVIRSIPCMDLGAWGYIHSAEVEQVINDNEMVVDDIWLIDADELKQRKKEMYEQIKDEMEDEAERRERMTGRRQRVDYGAIRDAVDYVFEQRENLADLQRDRSFREPVRVVGFSTAGLIQRTRWMGHGDGAQIAIVKMEEYNDKGKTRLVAVPARWFRDGLDEEGFIEMLRERNMTVPEFVKFMQDVKLHRPDNGEEVIFRILMPAIDRYK